MKRLPLIVVASAALAIIVALSTHRLRTERGVPANVEAATPQTSAGEQPPASKDAQTADVAAATTAADAKGSAPASDIERWVVETASSDASTRAAAIAALGEAPKDRAVPVLKRVLEMGEPQLDRQIALRSLHKLALQQGDDDGRIREVMRVAVYHGDDESASESAQAYIEDIEAELADRPQP